MHYFIKAFYGKLNLIPHLLKLSWILLCFLVRALKLCKDEWPPASTPASHGWTALSRVPAGNGLPWLGLFCPLPLSNDTKVRIPLLQQHSGIRKMPCNRASCTQIIWKEDLAADISTADTPQTLPGCEGFLSLWKKMYAWNAIAPSSKVNAITE